MAPSERHILDHLRKICLALPGASETVTFGHPTFRARNKTFAVLETYKGELSVCCKVGKSMLDIFLQDKRFYRTPYIGQHGWVSLRTAGTLNWDEVAELVGARYQLVRGPARSKP